jgi:replication factor C subunit 2/4
MNMYESSNKMSKNFEIRRKDDLKKKNILIRKNLPWIEKYRPNKIENIMLDGPLKKRIQKMIVQRDIPNIILQGTPGIGKTSTIKCIAKEMYGKYYKHMVLDVNASDNRGIKIQNLIENFRKTCVSIKEEDKESIAKFKLVILDEADNMTDKARHIISGFLEKNSDDIKFAFTCNNKHNITPSIQSRCDIIKYPLLTEKIVVNRLKEILEIETKKNYDDMSKDEQNNLIEGLKTIYSITNGDLRNAINILQLTNLRFDNITKDNVYHVYDKPHPEKSREIIDACYDKDLAKGFERIIHMREQGYSGIDIALGLFTTLQMNICDHLPEKTKIEFSNIICESVYYIDKGLDSSLTQITNCIAKMCS